MCPSLFRYFSSSKNCTPGIIAQALQCHNKIIVYNFQNIFLCATNLMCTNLFWFHTTSHYHHRTQCAVICSRSFIHPSIRSSVRLFLFCSPLLFLKSLLPSITFLFLTLFAIPMSNSRYIEMDCKWWCPILIERCF